MANAKMRKAVALLAVLLLAGVVDAADVCMAVLADDPDRTLTVSDLEALGESDDLVKTGGGRLVIDFDLAAAKPGWRGSVRVKEGFVRVAHVGAFGSSTATGGVVEEGATVEFDGSVLGSSSLSCPRLAFVGGGVEGDGAVRLVGGNWSHKEMHWTLTGDATWSSGGYAETFNYGPAGSIDMGGGGGYTLTVRGNGGTLALASASDGFFANPGHLVVCGGANLKTEQVKFGGTEANTLTFADSCKWTIANLPRTSCLWKIVVSSGVTVDMAAVSWSAEWPSDNCGWGGPIEIAAGGKLAWNAQFNAGSQQVLTLDGRVSGEGRLVCNYGFLHLTNPENSIAEIQNYCGRLIADSLSSVLPSFANSKFYTNYAAATSVVQVVAADMTEACDAAVLNFMENYPTGFRGTGNGGLVTLLLSSDWSYSSAFAGTFREVPFGNGGIGGLPESGGFRISGPVSGENPVAVTQAGTELLFVGEGSHAIGELRLSGGTTTFAGDGFWDLGTRRHFVGAEQPDIARLNVDTSAVLGNRDSSAAGTAIDVGRSPLGPEKTVRGILTLNGGTLSNCVSMLDDIGTKAPRSHGSFVLKSGTYFCNDTSGGNILAVGGSIGGYLSLQGGQMHVQQGWFTVGQGANGFGVFEQLGGNYAHDTYGLGIGRAGGHGHAYFGGGAASLVSLRLCHSLWASAESSAGVRATVTIDGSAHVQSRALQLGASSDSVTLLNLNGGVFETVPTFAPITNSTQLNASMTSFAFTNNLVCLYLNGGELRPTAGSSNLFPTPEDPGLFRLVVGPGGFRLNTCRSDGKTMVFTERRPLAPPTGLGIGSIPVPEAAPWTYAGAPYVEIEGDGWGASALAQFDTEQGVVTNVLVTSPGCDYTWAKARFVKGGAVQDVEVSLDGNLVEQPADGGVSVWGGGAVTFAGENAYRGATRIGSDTTVVFWTPSCYPNDGAGRSLSALVNAGGTFTLGSPNATEIQFPSVSGHGRIVGGCGSQAFRVVVADALIADADDLLAGRTLEISGRLSLSADARVRIVGGEALAAVSPGTRLVVAAATMGATAETLPVLEGLDENWAVRVGSHGVRLLRKGSGMMLIVR